MARTKGAINKEQNLPTVYSLTTEERIEMLAVLILDIVNEELCTTE